MKIIVALFRKNSIRFAFVVGALLIATLFGTLPGLTHKASALSIASWNAGEIIDDVVFTNHNSMNVQEIQQFLNSKVPNCDTWGTQTSEFGGGTRAQWGTARGYPPPYVCLKDYSENGISSAQIIYNLAQQYTINPQVLIVLLQKEQSLVTDTWPLSTQYKTATGYGCPDTAACDSQYFGLTNQLNWSSRMFRAILNATPTWYTPYVLGNNYIQYNPNASCGGSVVNIQNRSTQALYNYTPYQPNAAALNAGYGTGYCGAYGNRNFFLYFNDWFGSTRVINPTITLSKPLTVSSTSDTVYMGETVTASYEISNTASYAVDAGGFGVCARIDNTYYDFGFNDSNVIPANSAITVSYSKKLDQPGALSLFTCSYNGAIGGWASATYPYDGNITLARTKSMTVIDNPIVTSSVSLAPAVPIVGQPVTATITIKNSGSIAVNIGTMVIAARDSKGNNVDFPADPSLTIPENSTVTYAKTQTFNSPGSYSYFLANLNNGAWSTTYPRSTTGMARSGNFTIKDNPLVTSGITLSPASHVAGDNTTANLTIQNYGPTDINIGTMVIAARDSKGNNVDFPADNNVIILANSTYTYSKSRVFAEGSYSAFVANYRLGNWDMNYPKSADNTIIRNQSFSVAQNPTITTGVTLSPANPVAGEPVTATITIKNSGSIAVNIGTMVIAARDSKGNNVDFPADPSLTIPENSTVTYAKTQTFNSPGSYSYFLANLNNGAWSTTYPKSDATVVKSGNFHVNDNPLITSSMIITPTAPVAGQTVTASITIRNSGSVPVSVGLLVFAARDPQNGNVDFPSDTELIIPANSTITYSKSRTFNTGGNYYIFVADYKNNTWSGSYPVSSASNLIRSANITIH